MAYNVFRTNYDCLKRNLPYVAVSTSINNVFGQTVSEEKASKMKINRSTHSSFILTDSTRLTHELCEEINFYDNFMLSNLLIFK